MDIVANFNAKLRDLGGDNMNLLKINNLKKTFGGNVLFDNLSLEINTKDKVALIGRNGVGKTTLIKLILMKYMGKIEKKFIKTLIEKKSMSE